MKNSFGLVAFAAFVLVANGSFHFAESAQPAGLTEMASEASDEVPADSPLIFKNVNPARIQLKLVKSYLGTSGSILVKLDGEELACIGADEAMFDVRRINHTGAQIFQYTLSPAEVSLRIAMLRQKLMEKASANETVTINLLQFYTGGIQSKQIELDELLKLIK